MQPSLQREAEALELVYARCYESFCRLATTVTRNSDAARDAVQEGFARALSGLHGYRGEGSLEGWVWRIILRTALDIRSAEPHLMLLVDADTSSKELTWGVDIPYPERDPELTAALRALPPRQRLIVFLRYFADLSHADIADITEIRLGTVSATLVQAKATLAQKLGFDRCSQSKEEQR